MKDKINLGVFSIAVLGVVLVVIGFFTNLRSLPAVGGVMLAIGIVYWMFFTESGRRMRAETKAREEAEERQRQRKRPIQCANCGWKGTMGRWIDSDGCPRCRSDLIK